MTQVREELAVLTAQYRKATAQPELSVSVRDTAPGVPNDRGTGLIFSLLGVAVTLVWGLTCANVGNLFLARSLRRDREIAVRLSLGATRGRLVRQLLAEGLLLAAVAGAAAFACTAGVPIVMEKIDGTAAMFAPDWVVAAVAALGTLATCLLVALAPALQATRIAWKTPVTATVRAGRLREVVRRRSRSRRCCPGATLIARGIGQRRMHGLTLRSKLQPPWPSSLAHCQGRHREAQCDPRVADERRVEQWQPPVGGGSESASERAGFRPRCRSRGRERNSRQKLLALSAAALHVLEVPIVEGRAHDDNPAAGEAVVNQTLARRLSPGESVVGKTLVLDYDDRTYTIAGVARDAHLTALGAVEPLIHISPSGRTSDIRSD